MNQTEQMLRDILQAIETVLADSYHRHFAECCGRSGQGYCCGDFIEQWTPEDHKILDTLSPIQRQLSQALSHVKETPKNEHDRDDVLKKAGNLDMMREALRALDFIKAAATPQSGITYQHIKAIEQALAAEPAPLVRLTDEELKKMFGYEYAEDFYHANAIMDAMERVNK